MLGRDASLTPPILSVWFVLTTYYIYTGPHGVRLYVGGVPYIPSGSRLFYTIHRGDQGYIS